MSLDKDSNMPLYLQLKKAIMDMINSGELKPGNPMKTEAELCAEFGISRYPVRQALAELVEEGFLNRTRGRGTFINAELPARLKIDKSKLLGLVLNHLTAGFNSQILYGFEKQARRRGFLTVACSSEGNDEEELNCIEKLIDANVSGMFIFPCDNSRLHTKLGKLKENRIFLGLLDRDPVMSNIDYVGSDNLGGAYSAVRHISIQGFRNVAFISDMKDVSSVNERIEGFLKAVEDFDLEVITRIDIKEDISKLYHFTHRFYIEKLREELIELKKHTPFGVFAINDGIAIYCMNIFKEEGLIIGKDVAVVGFDNINESEYPDINLTTVAQNGLLLGQSAADIAIDKLEGKTNQVYRSIIPTQLVVRNSCGERG
jgi:GntR family transcriptional regulator, arabinose operon transcriptional repressor